MYGRILIMDDDSDAVSHIAKALVARGHVVDHQPKPFCGMRDLYARDYDLVLLDSHFPGMDGYTICKRLRKDKVDTPILMLTDKPKLDDIVLTFRAGADGYLKKPLSLVELVAHTEALLVRPPKLKQERIQYKDFMVNKEMRKIYKANKLLNVRNREFDLFTILLANPGMIFSREALLQISSSGSQTGSLGSIDVHISNIRKLLRKVGERNLIHTIHQKGYKLE